MRASLLSLPLLLASGALLAQREAKIPDPDPEVERRSFKVADGFEVSLFAADPLLAKPIQMNFDAAGRLWIASSATYPQIKPGQKADDKIIVLEDTKGVGKADKTTVFAGGLLIPTGLEPGDGGVYVANSTELLHLSASKPGGVADVKKVILSGFGTEDTHHILHTLRWGHDGNLYMNQSVYIHSHIETPYGVRRLNAGGVWQFRPETRKLEVFTRGLWNSWGHHFDRFGQSFLTDGAGGQGVYVAFPGAAYDPAPGAARTLQGLNPGSPKYCGLEIVSGSHLPDDWQGSLITCDFRAHRVCRFALAPSGSGYTARLMPDVIKATHPAFRPIDVKQGPDGAIYVADWYNPIIQHGEVDFRDPRRDVTHGRIWRITAKGRKPAERPKLIGATAEALVKHLGSPEPWTRHFARRELKEKFGAKAAPELKKWLGTLDPKKAEHEPSRLEGLWAYQTLDVAEPALLASLLEARDGRVRAAAVRVLGAWHARVDRPLELLERRVADEHPQVRLEAVRALSLVGGKRSAEIALRALDRPLDTDLDYGLWLTLRELEPDWLPALTAGTFDFGTVGRLSFALQAVGSNKVIGPLVNLLKGGKLAKGNEDAALVLLAGVGGPGELAYVLEKATAKDVPTGRRARLLAALEENARQRNVKPSGSLGTIVKLVEARDPTADRLAGLWSVPEAIGELVGQAEDEKASVELRSAAIDGLAGLGSHALSQRTLFRLADNGAPAIRRRALIALAGFDLDAAATRAAGVLSALEGGTGAEGVFAAFLQRKGGAAALTKALASQKLPADVARVGVRTVRTSGREAPGLAEALTKAGGLTFGVKVLDPKALARMVEAVAAKGDAARGEVIFRRSDLRCLSCHAIGGAGGQVGPDLSSIGASAQVDYLIESLLQPSKAIKEGYNSTLVTTTRGRQMTGIRVRETPTTLVLRDDQDKEISISTKDIDEKGASKVSLMPEGLTDTLTGPEMLDLVRFLSELGKGERWSVGRARVARRWEALSPTKPAYDAYFRRGVGSLASEAGLTWEPAFSTVSGSLPLAGLPALRPGKAGPPVVLVRTRLEATAASKVQLKVAPKGLTAWLDGEPASGADGLALDLKPGRHTLTFAVSAGELKDGVLRVEIEDGPASAAVRFAGGK